LTTLLNRQGIWEGEMERGFLPSVARSKDQQTLAIAEHRRVRLQRFPSLKGAVSKPLAAHASHIAAVAFLQDDTKVVSAGGTDLCIFQYRHDPEVNPGARGSVPASVRRRTNEPLD
jgi:hypothetical protein